MIDPGRPFSVPYAGIIAALEDRLRNGVEQPDQRSFIFKSGVTSYELPPSASAITRVSGLRNAQFQVFEAGTHFRFGGNRLMWLDNTFTPDEGSRFDVEYTYRDIPPGLTDFNAGSVIGTLVRAFAREMKLLYEQMDEAYRRAFIDQATGAALDNVVALLGVMRKPAVAADGTVTFSRKTAPARTVQIPKGTRVADQAGRIFLTQEAATIPPATGIEETTTQTAGVVKTQKVVAELTGIWRTADNPDTTASLPVRPGFGSDGQSITLDLPGPALPVEPLRLRYKPAAVQVAIQAEKPGPDGNVGAATLTIMPTPPPGVDGVTNEQPTQGGQDAEQDDSLRERAKHALERAGNATTNAIRFAVLEVTGVEGVEVIDRNVDDSIPPGEVRVRYTGGNIEDVRRAVEQTRAAGIIARLEQIIEVSISGTFYLIPVAPGPASAAAAAFVAKAIDAMKALAIAAPLSVRKLNSLAFDVPGLADVAEAQLSFTKSDQAHPGATLTGTVEDPFLIARTEIIRPDANNLRAVVLTAITSPGTQKTAPLTVAIDVQLTDGAGSPVTFRQFVLNLNVVVRAYAATNPDQPPERIANFTRQIQFSGAAVAALQITPGDLTSFRPADHEPELEFIITAAAYPGLQGVTVKADVS